MTVLLSYIAIFHPTLRQTYYALGPLVAACCSLLVVFASVISFVFVPVCCLGVAAPLCCYPRAAHADDELFLIHPPAQVVTDLHPIILWAHRLFYVGLACPSLPCLQLAEQTVGLLCLASCFPLGCPGTDYNLCQDCRQAIAFACHQPLLVYYFCVYASSRSMFLFVIVWQPLRVRCFVVCGFFVLGFFLIVGRQCLRLAARHLLRSGRQRLGLAARRVRHVWGNLCSKFSS